MISWDAFKKKENIDPVLTSPIQEGYFIEDGEEPEFKKEYEDTISKAKKMGFEDCELGFMVDEDGQFQGQFYYKSITLNGYKIEPYLNDPNERDEEYPAWASLTFEKVIAKIFCDKCKKEIEVSPKHSHYIIGAKLYHVICYHGKVKQ